MAGQKHDSGKADWTLVPWEAMEGVVRVLQYGANLYGRDNWMAVEDHERRYWSAAMRHLLAWQSGEVKDPGSGESHLSHAICGLLFLSAREGK